MGQVDVAIEISNPISFETEGESSRKTLEGFRAL